MSPKQALYQEKCDSGGRFKTEGGTGIVRLCCACRDKTCEKNKSIQMQEYFFIDAGRNIYHSPKCLLTLFLFISEDFIQI